MMSKVRGALDRARSGKDSDAAGVDETMRAVRHALSSAGGAAAGYSCTTVSWDDVSRGSVGGALSCWGGNITDSYLKARDGTPLFTVRSQNWNEKLGVVRASDVALLVGNGEGSGVGAAELRNVTLEKFLRDPAAIGARYTGMEEDVCLADAALDAKVSIRFQTVFLPVNEDEDGRGRMQFAGEAYNYQTASDEDPRNLVLLATTQGLSVQCDGKGAKRMLLHAGGKGEAKEYWLEAESSKHKVGGEQKETQEERKDAIKRGKATSEVIGIKAMGTRFNVLMTIQIPLELQKKTLTRSEFAGFGGSVAMTGAFGSTFSVSPLGACGAGPQPPPAPPCLPCSSSKTALKPASSSFAPAYGQKQRGAIVAEPCMATGIETMAALEMAEAADEGGTHDDEEIACDIGVESESAEKEESSAPSAFPLPKPKKKKAVARRATRSRAATAVSPREGCASAARVSRGDFYGKHKGIPVSKPRRNSGEHVTVTCVLYNTVIGGVPNEVDVLAAVNDMENLYAACTESGRLADAAFSFMKSELTVKNVLDIEAKINSQAPVAEIHVAPDDSATSLSNKELVTSKFDEIEASFDATKVLELKLLTLGALDGQDEAKALVSGKFDAALEAGNTGSSDALKELRLIVIGALSS